MAIHSDRGGSIVDCDVLIVGGGIVGLSQAWAAAREGNRVIVLDRRPASLGASVRNFGMIWPIGQPPGTRLELALRSVERWRDLADLTGIYRRECGSLFVATDDDEADVMREFAAKSDALGYETEFLSAAQAAARSPLVRTDTVVGGLASKTELNVDPREAMPALASMLTDRDVGIHYETFVAGITDRIASTTDGRRFRGRRVMICQGDDASHLYGDIMRNADVFSCKLHMMRTPPITHDMGVMLATGLTLRHYRSFEVCDSLPAYRRRVAGQSADLDRFGIHVMVSQDRSGRLILGDSHQYGPDVEPFDDEVIDTLILDELRKRFNLPGDAVEQRWKGYYVKSKSGTLFVADPEPDVRILNGLGGNGMTLSFGIADRMWENWDEPELLAGLPDPDLQIATQDATA